MYFIPAQTPLLAEWRWSKCQIELTLEFSLYSIGLIAVSTHEIHAKKRGTLIDRYAVDFAVDGLLYKSGHTSR